MAEELKDLMKDSDSDVELDITHEDIDALLKDDVVHEPQVKPAEQLSKEDLSEVLEKFKQMHPHERNNLLSSISDKFKMNPEQKEYEEMSESNYVRLRLKQKIYEKRMMRAGKKSREELMERHKNNTSHNTNTDSNNDDSNISEKTLKNRKKRAKKKAQMERRREKLKNENELDDDEKNLEKNIIN
jgi:hypothetical protein